MRCGNRECPDKYLKQVSSCKWETFGAASENVAVLFCIKQAKTEISLASIKGGQKMYRLNFSFLSKYRDLLLQGIGTTLILVLCCLVIGFFLGYLLALMKQSKNKFLHGFASIFVDILRNTPFIVQLFFFFYGLPTIGIDTEPLTTSIIALGINTSAQNCELIRSGMLAIKNDYYECAEALGYGKLQIIRYFEIPISFRIAFKSLVNNFINMVLTSSVCFSISLVETMGAAKIISGRVSRPFEIYLVIMLLYCIFTYIISIVAKFINRKIEITL